MRFYDGGNYPELEEFVADRGGVIQRLKEVPGYYIELAIKDPPLPGVGAIRPTSNLILFVRDAIRFERLTHSFTREDGVNYIK